MRAVVYPSQIAEGLGHPLLYQPPPSKSHFQRLCAAALLHAGTTTIFNPGRSEDDAAAMRIIEAMGAVVERSEDFVRVKSDGKVQPRTGVIHCGESGLSARLFTPIAAQAASPVRIEGAGSLLTRPMDSTIEALQALGVVVSSSNERLPLVVHGPLEPRSAVVDGSLSSQTVSGLLFAFAAGMKNGNPVTLRARGLVSRPYLEMSCDVLQCFGWHVRFDGFETCLVAPRQQHLPPQFQIDTEPDWSSIAPVAVAAAFGGGGVQIAGGYYSSNNQADTAIAAILERAGAEVDEWEGHDGCIISPGLLRGFEADCTHTPDLVPILAILASACAGRSSIAGLHRLAHKESNRAETTSSLLAQLGISHRIVGDALIIHGPQTPRSATVQSHNDHRIVMAAAVAGLLADGPVTIEGAEAVRKSYPDFFWDLRALGVTVEVQE